MCTSVHWKNREKVKGQKRGKRENEEELGFHMHCPEQMYLLLPIYSELSVNIFGAKQGVFGK